MTSWYPKPFDSYDSSVLGDYLSSEKPETIFVSTIKFRTFEFSKIFLKIFSSIAETLVTALAVFSENDVRQTETRRFLLYQLQTLRNAGANPAQTIHFYQGRSNALTKG